MDKTLTFCRIGLLLLLTAAVALAPADVVVDRSVKDAIAVFAAADVIADVALDPVPLAEVPLLLVDDGDVPLSESFSMLSEYRARLAGLVNTERGKAGLGPLSVSELLQAAADVRAAELESLYSHTRPDGREWSTIRRDFELPGRGAGENLHKAYPEPEQVMASWMNSSDHKSNILMPEWNRLGVGIHVGSDGTMYWAIIFTD